MRHLLFAILLIAGTASAQSLPWNTDQLAWTAPTKCTDGSAVATGCPISGFRIETAKSALATTWATVATVSAVTLGYTLATVAAGTNCYRVIALSTTNADPTNVACSDAIQPAPLPAVLKTIDTLAYKLDLGYSNQLKVARIGTVPLGASCRPDMYAMGLNVLSDRNKVTLTPGATSRPLTTFGKCG